MRPIALFHLARQSGIIYIDNPSYGLFSLWFSRLPIDGALQKHRSSFTAEYYCAFMWCWKICCFSVFLIDGKVNGCIPSNNPDLSIKENKLCF